eukprot:TRINITY_DN22728_c0_g1_i1.p1 TRINITY_DN22728_c0_g1~~TRINITY_DN22728_c0_g1_i1.p1  ORF type:complete len:328 (-),score=87.74 TRINITY_DN22728_c0_g1_i1:24-1007(-)
MSGEDANPLNRRLPAEVVTRQSKVKKVIEKISDDVQVDLKVALSLKPEARLRWLSKAFKMVEERKVPSTDLYDIVSNRKFCGTMQSKNSQKLRAIVAESMALFSDKQQRFLRSDEWAPNKLDEEREADGEGSAALPEADESTPASAAGAAADSKRRDSKGVAEPSNDGGGGWTWTVRERPLPDAASSSKKKKLESNATEVSSEKTKPKSQVLSQKQQEEEVDSSLQLLERLNQHKVEEQPPPSSRDRRREEPKKRRREPSRSRSISAASLSSSSRGRRRGKRRKDGGKKGAVNFEDALRRRMQERESQVETSRLPVVDPGHARKAWR